MNNRISIIYLALVLVQGLHSIEEYFGKLWEMLPIANWLTGLVSEDHHYGFLVVNIGLFVFGISTWFFIVRKGNPLASFILWFMIILEMTNGVGHTVWAIYSGQYTPGLITAPLLFIIAFYLMRIYLSEKIRTKKEVV